MKNDTTKFDLNTISDGLDRVVREQIETSPYAGFQIRLSSAEIKAITDARDYLVKLKNSYAKRPGRTRKFATDAEMYAYHNERRKQQKAAE
jgi:hypothetical protein